MQSAPGAIHLELHGLRRGSGTLVVTSSGTTVAAIDMLGSYTSANFSARAAGDGSVEIFDPVVPNGGSVELGAAGTFPREGIDLPKSP